MKSIYQTLLFSALWTLKLCAADREEQGGALARPWTVARTANVHSRTGLYLATIETNVFLWTNSNRKDEKSPCQLLILANENLVWFGRNSYTNFVSIKDKIVGLAVIWGLDIFVNISTNRMTASTTEDRALQLNVLRQRFANPALHERLIELSKIVGGLAFHREGHADTSPPSVKKIAVSELDVTLVPEGVNGAVTEIIFDKEMEPIRATLNGKTTFEKLTKQFAPAPAPSGRKQPLHLPSLMMQREQKPKPYLRSHPCQPRPLTGTRR